MGLIRTRLADLPEPDAWPLPPRATSAIPMQTHAWTRARLEALPPGQDVRLYAVREGSAIAAIAPLVRVGDWLREPPALFEPGDFPWRSPEGLRELAGLLAAQPLPLYLERVPVDSLTLPLLRRAYARRGFVQVRPAMPTPTIPLTPGGDLHDVLNAGRRSDLRRLERKARAFGEPTYDFHEPRSTVQVDMALAEAYAVEARSWKEDAGTSLTADPWQGAFFRRFAAEAAKTGILRLAFLRIDGQPVAMQIAVEWRRRLWLLKISHDAAYARCSPGQLLIAHTLAEASRRGLEAYEFMGVMADWTKLWTYETRGYVQIRAIPLGAAAAKLLIKRGIRAALGRLRR